MNTPPDHESDDPWFLLAGRSNAVHTPEPPALRIQIIEDVEPLDAQIGVSPKKTAPDALHDALFGQPEPTELEIAAVGGDPSAVPAMQTYAILDAARTVNLPEMLEQSGLEHRCLFKGKAYDELKNVAPWIVHLEEGSSFTRNLFTRTDAAWHFWGAGVGIHVRSRGSLDDMYRHFRKFTRIQDERGKWHYLAFWSHPLGIQMFLRGNETAISPLVRKILAMPNHALSVMVASDDVCAVIDNPHGRDDAKQSWILTRPAWDFIRQVRREQQFDEVAQITWRHAAPHIAVREREFFTTLRGKRDLWFQIGFWRRDHLAKLCSWESLLGPDFLEGYADGAVREIVRSSRSPHEAVARIEALLDSHPVRPVAER